MPAPSALVLVTGVTGYIGSFVALALLRKGYRVRGTMRNPAKADRVRAALGEHMDVGRLEIAQAELLDAASWRHAAQGCEYVMHVASPIAAAIPKDPDELIVPAREGTLNVLRAATEAGVKAGRRDLVDGSSSLWH